MKYPGNIEISTDSSSSTGVHVSTPLLSIACMPACYRYRYSILNNSRYAYTCTRVVLEYGYMYCIILKYEISIPVRKIAIFILLFDLFFVKGCTFIPVPVLAHWYKVVCTGPELKGGLVVVVHAVRGFGEPPDDCFIAILPVPIGYSSISLVSIWQAYECSWLPTE